MKIFRARVVETKDENNNDVITTINYRVTNDTGADRTYTLNVKDIDTGEVVYTTSITRPTAEDETSTTNAFILTGMVPGNTVYDFEIEVSYGTGTPDNNGYGVFRPNLNIDMVSEYYAVKVNNVPIFLDTYTVTYADDLYIYYGLTTGINVNIPSTLNTITVEFSENLDYSLYYKPNKGVNLYSDDVSGVTKNNTFDFIIKRENESGTGIPSIAIGLGPLETLAYTPDALESGESSNVNIVSFLKGIRDFTSVVAISTFFGVDFNNYTEFFDDEATIYWYQILHMYSVPNMVNTGNLNYSFVETPIGISTPREWEAIGNDSGTMSFSYKLLNDIDFATDDNWDSSYQIPLDDGYDRDKYPVGDTGVLKWNPKNEKGERITINSSGDVVANTYAGDNYNQDIGYRSYMPTAEEITTIEASPLFDHWGGMRPIGSYNYNLECSISLDTNGYTLANIYMDYRRTDRLFETDSDKLTKNVTYIAPILNITKEFSITGDVTIVNSVVMCAVGSLSFIGNTSKLNSEANGIGAILQDNNFNYYNCVALAQSHHASIVNSPLGRYCNKTVHTDAHCKVICLGMKIDNIAQGAATSLVCILEGLLDRDETMEVGYSKLYLDGEVISHCNSLVGVTGAFAKSSPNVTLVVKDFKSKANITIYNNSEYDANSKPKFKGCVAVFPRADGSTLTGGKCIVEKGEWSGTITVPENYNEYVGGIFGRAYAEPDDNSKVTIKNFVNKGKLVGSSSLGAFGDCELWVGGYSKLSGDVAESETSCTAHYDNEDDAVYVQFENCSFDEEEWNKNTTVDIPGIIPKIMAGVKKLRNLGVYHLFNWRIK